MYSLLIKDILQNGSCLHSVSVQYHNLIGQQMGLLIICFRSQLHKHIYKKDNTTTGTSVFFYKSTSKWTGNNWIISNQRRNDLFSGNWNQPICLKLITWTTANRYPLQFDSCEVKQWNIGVMKDMLLVHLYLEWRWWRHLCLGANISLPHLVEIHHVHDHGFPIKDPSTCGL